MTGPASCPISNCQEDTTTTSICPDHRTRLATALTGGLARLYVELNIALRPGRTGSDEPNVTRSTTTPLPISTTARTAQQDLLALVEAAEDHLRAHRGWISRPLRGREGPRLQGCCNVLADNLDELLRLPHGTAFAVALHTTISQARFAAGKTGGSKTNRIDMPCPTCDMRALRRHNGTDDIACAYCGISITAQQLDDLLDPPTQQEAA